MRHIDTERKTTGFSLGEIDNAEDRRKREKTGKMRGVRNLSYWGESGGDCWRRFCNFS